MLHLTLFLFVATVSAAEQKWSAADIMKKNEDARKVLQLQAKGKITIDGGARKRMEKTFSWWRKLNSDGVHYNTLTKFHTPATVKDQSILFLEAEGDKNEILMYLPAFKKTRMVESSQQNQSFMASDFSFTDITALHNEDYTYIEDGLVDCPNAKPGKCYQITAKIKNPRSVERLGYSKLELWIREDTFMSDFIRYYDRTNKLFKELKTSDTVPLSKNTFFTKYLEMKNLSNGQFTILEFSDLDFKTTIPEAKFYKQKLGKDV